MNKPKITNVVPEDNLIIIVSFSDGLIKKYDCNQVVEKNENYHKLKDPFYFKNIHIDTGGHGIGWDDDVDISEYEILQNGSDIT